MAEKCSICRRNIENEEPAILTVGGFGNPKYLCEECDAELVELTDGVDFEKINLAMENIGKKLIDARNEDKLVHETLKEIKKEAKERIEKIKSGEYVREENLKEDEEIPEELLESDEDKALDKAESERNAKIDKIMNWVCGILVSAAFIFFIYKILDAYLF